MIKKGKSYYKNFWCGDSLVDICCATAQVIEKNDLVRNKVFNPELAIIANGKILFDKSGEMKDIQKKAKHIWKLGPKKCGKKDYEEAGYLCAIFLHKLSKNNSEFALCSWNEVLKKTIRIFFELHNVWQPKLFNVEDAIKDIDKDFYHIYLKAYATKGKERIRNTKKMVSYLVNKFTLPQSFEYSCLKADD